MDIIHVGLYGGKGLFGGRETPLEADVIYCDKYKECTYYKRGQCYRVRSFSGYCKFGKNQVVRGYTSRAMKYGEFRSRWTGHEKYAKLKVPEQKLGLIGDIVVFPYPYIDIKDGEIKQQSFSTGIKYVNKDQFTPQLINQICKQRPLAMMGGVITSYKEEVVPKFLAHLKEVMPEKYSELITAYPEYDKEINYVGRKALLKTINPSMVHYRSDRYPEFNETWEWDGEHLTYVKGYVSDPKIAKSYDVVMYKIKPADKTVITITDNAQVLDKTVFTN